MSSRCRFGETLVDDGQQCVRAERLPQAARGAEFESHPEKIRRRRNGIREGISGHRYQRSSRRTFVEYPDRLEAAHVRHEDVDEHHVERRGFKRMDACFSAVSDGYFEAPALQIDLDGCAYHRVVVDHAITPHDSSPPTDIRPLLPVVI